MSIENAMTDIPEEPESGERRDPLLVAAIVRAFTVVDYLAQAPTPPKLGDIAKDCDINFQSAQRITNGLIDSGYLVRDERLKTFRFSLRTLDLQYNYLRTNNLLKAAWPILMTLREQTGLRVSLCVLDGTNIVYLLRLASSAGDFETMLIGRRRTAALTPGGLAILSALSPEERGDIVAASDLTPLTPRSVIDRDAIFARLEACATDGFCIEEQEVRTGEISAAIPLAPVNGKVTHAIVAAGPSVRHSPDSLRQQVIPLLQNAGIALSRS
jgi:IclR family pca regulon transcriptional regulator